MNDMTYCECCRKPLRKRIEYCDDCIKEGVVPKEANKDVYKFSECTICGRRMQRGFDKCPECRLKEYNFSEKRKSELNEETVEINVTKQQQDTIYKVLNGKRGELLTELYFVKKNYKVIKLEPSSISFKDAFRENLIKLISKTTNPNKENLIKLFKISKYKTSTVIGIPDFIAFRDEAEIIFIEAKNLGDLSKDQKEMANKLFELGFETYRVRVPPLVDLKLNGILNIASKKREKEK